VGKLKETRNGIHQRPYNTKAVPTVHLFVKNVVFLVVSNFVVLPGSRNLAESQLGAQSDIAGHSWGMPCSWGMQVATIWGARPRAQLL
jgi:hypothetical protein